MMDTVRPEVDAATAITRLLATMAALRDPETGCPWDRVQSWASIAPFTIEEAYEVAGAIAAKDWDALPDELGDLLLQVVYHARLAEEAGLFTFADVTRRITDKMVRRHPHVFGTGPGEGWDAHKRAERYARQQTGALAGVDPGLPALSHALKLTSRAARVGFDWPDATAVLVKLQEEIAELEAEIPAADQARLADEMGDLLFVAANLARKLGLDPEACLHQASTKFTRRFQGVEATLAAEGLAPSDATLEQMEQHWAAVKRAERFVIWRDKKS